jgi:hypothetical protein
MAVSIVDEFLTRTTQAGFKLAQESDVMTLSRVAIPGAGLFAASFAIRYLAQGPGREVVVALGPIEVMIHIGPEYLRQVNPLELVMIAQADFFHPNFRWPVLCLGGVRPGTPLPTLLRHVYEIITYQNFSTDDGLNPDACQRLRDEPALLDRLGRTPRLTRRRLELDRELNPL